MTKILPRKSRFLPVFARFLLLLPLIFRKFALVKHPKTGGKHSNSYANMTNAIAIAFVVLLVLILLLSKNSNKEADPEQLREKLKEYMREAEQPKTYNYNSVVVVGIKYRKKQAHEALKDAKEGDTVQLMAEPENKYDDRAVKVCFNNIHVGYLHRELAHKVFEHIAKVEKCVISSVIEFTDVPHLNIDLSYIGTQGLSQEAIDFILKHQKELGL